MSKDKDISISFGLGLLAGVVGGIIGAIMLAPTSGEETRNNLANKISSIKENLPNDVKCAKNKSFYKIEKIKVAFENLCERINSSVKAKKMANAKLLEAKTLKEQI